MEEVLAVYERPYNGGHPVVALDESRKQLVSETVTGFTAVEGVDTMIMHINEKE
jgi:hypothetical protein